MLILRYKIIFSHQHLWLALAVGRVRAEAFRSSFLSHPPDTMPLYYLTPKRCYLFWPQLNHLKVPKKGEAEIKIFELLKKYGLTEPTTECSKKHFA